MKAHGPKLRDYSISMPKKVRALGMMIVLAAKFREGNLIILDNFNVESHKTKDLLDKLALHGITEEKLTVIADSYENMLERDPVTKQVNPLVLAARNIPWLHALPQSKLDVYNLMQKPRLVVTQDALLQLQDRVLKQYTNTGKLNKYSPMMEQYQELVEAGASSAEGCKITTETKYELAV